MVQGSNITLGARGFDDCAAKVARETFGAQGIQTIQISDRSRYAVAFVVSSCPFAEGFLSSFLPSK